EARGERKGRHRGPLAGAAAAAPRAAGRRRGGRTQRAGAADPRRHRPRGAARRRRHPPGRGAAGRGARDPPRTRAARSGPPAPRQALLPARRLKTTATDLVIVESPAKARTLGKYLGRNYQVKASIGHVMDLPKSKFGVDIERDFAPEYHVIQGKAKVLEEIKKAAQDKENVYLAPDPDREGEAIAWHIAQKLGRRRRNVHRVLFNEITKKAVLEALRNPGKLDKNRFDAQQARRILDRLVGYKLSPLLWDKVRRGLSAGRVQSVAVRIICERERDNRAFTPRENGTVEARLGAVARSPQGAGGPTTYTPADSTRSAGEAPAAARDYIQGRYGAPYLPESPQVYRSKKDAQDAHEAIRPTSMEYEPERVAAYLDKDGLALYTLIWNRFVASQMESAVYDATAVDVEAGTCRFRATGQVLTFHDFIPVYPEGRDGERREP